MPIYDFICQNCHKQFDELVPFNWKESDVKCPICNSKELELAVSLVGAFQSGGKTEMLNHSSHSCGSCSTGGCGTCN